MKKIFYILILISCLGMLTAADASALTPTPAKAGSLKITSTPEPTDGKTESTGEKINAQINQLKERIASRVAELNLVEKRGTIGTITETSGNQISFTDREGEKRIIDVDEITKFSSPSAKSGFGLSDLDKGTKISVLGLFNKQSQRILARFIEVYNAPTFLSGRISDIDKANFTISVTDEENNEKDVDIENVTQISNYTKDDGISKFGFSKLSIGDRVMVTGFFDKKDASLLLASRVLDLAELPKNPKIVISEPTQEISPTEKIVPSTKALKVSPTLKISPSKSIATPAITKPAPTK